MCWIYGTIAVQEWLYLQCTFFIYLWTYYDLISYLIFFNCTNFELALEGEINVKMRYIYAYDCIYGICVLIYINIISSIIKVLLNARGDIQWLEIDLHFYLLEYYLSCMSLIGYLKVQYKALDFLTETENMIFQRSCFAI